MSNVPGIPSLLKQWVDFGSGHSLRYRNFYDGTVCENKHRNIDANVLNVVDIWIYKHLGIISRSCCDYEYDGLWYGKVPVALGRDTADGSVFPVCDEHGLPKLLEVGNEYSDEDACVIGELVSSDSAPSVKAKVVQDMVDLDRLLCEMTEVDLREFMWCEHHGFMHFSMPVSRVFAVCKHSRDARCGDSSKL